MNSMILLKFFQKVAHFKSFFQIIVLQDIGKVSQLAQTIQLNCDDSKFLMDYLVHVNSLQSFPSGVNYTMILILRLPFPYHHWSWQLYAIYFLRRKTKRELVCITKQTWWFKRWNTCSTLPTALINTEW